MNLVHGPLVTPPTLKPLAETKYPNDLGPNERRVGHMITYMDAIIGRFLDKVEELGLEENTLIIFTGDNGSARNLESRLSSFKVRGGKRTMNEAGTRVPFIARWPAVIKSGSVSDDTICHTDLLATAADITGFELPATAAEDSVSLLPLMKESPDEPVSDLVKSRSSISSPADIAIMRAISFLSSRMFPGQS